MSARTAATASVAVVPVRLKSPASTFRTSSLNLTRQVRVSRAVGETDGKSRSIEATRGAVVGAMSLSRMVTVAVGLAPTEYRPGGGSISILKVSSGSTIKFFHTFDSTTSGDSSTVRTVKVCEPAFAGMVTLSGDAS